MPVSAPQYDPNQRAQQAAQVKYGAAEAQINRAIEQGRLQEAAQKAALDQYGAGGRQVIGQTYDQLFGNLAANRTDSANQLGTQVNLVGQGYRDAGALAEQARSDSAARLARLAGTIHLSGEGQAAASSGMEQLASRILANNAQDDATRSGNLRTWAAQQDAFLGQGQAQAQREGAERKSSFENELVRALSELQADARNFEYGQQGSLLDLLNERGAFTVSAANDYNDQLYNQMLQAAQFNLGESEAQAQAQRAAAAQAMAERELGLKERSYEEGKQRDSLADYLALSQEQRAQKGFDLDYQLKTRGMNTPQSIQDWISMNNVDPQSFNLLMDEYNRAANEVAIANSIDYADLDPKNPKDQQTLSMQKYLGIDPAQVLLDRLSGGIPNYAGAYGPVASDRRNAGGISPQAIQQLITLGLLGGK